MSVIEVPSSLGNYTVHFAPTADFLQGFEGVAQRCYVIDSQVWEHYKNDCLSSLDPANVIVLEISEERKNLETVQELYDQLIERSAKRNLTLIVIGGGIVQDIAGFVASTLYRGVKWIFVPTTLLAQADSCIGGKTSLNYKAYKNLLGTFYPPSQVFIYAPFLATQQDLDFYSGLGEVVKLHILGGAAHAQEVLKLLPGMMRRDPTDLLTGVQNSLMIKHEYISEDEFDTGRRQLLNFGHCFGHALEATSNFEIPHGQAVVLGMLTANAVSRQRKLLSADRERFLAEQVLLPTLKARPKRSDFDLTGIVEAMKKDKKRTGAGLALIMIKDDYTALKVDDLTTEEAATALHEIKQLVV